MTAVSPTPPTTVLQRRNPTALVVALAVAGVLLNAMFMLFFVLWSRADEWATDRAEARGFDPTQLLPHGDLMWIAAHVALAALLCCDGFAAVVLIRVRGARSAR